MKNPEMGGMQPETKKERKPFEIEETPEGKFSVVLPTTIVEDETGKNFATGFEEKVFDTREEAQAKIDEINKSLDEAGVE
jgi:hypothetical protein